MAKRRNPSALPCRECGGRSLSNDDFDRSGDIRQFRFNNHCFTCGGDGTMRNSRLTVSYLIKSARNGLRAQGFRVFGRRSEEKTQD